MHASWFSHRRNSRLASIRFLPARKTGTFLAAATMLLLPRMQSTVCAGPLRAGAAKVDVTNRDARPVNDPLFVKALVLTDDKTTAVLVTIDAVAIAEIGSIRNEYLGKVRTQLKKDLNIEPSQVLVNACHCHGVVSGDIEQRTVQAVK